MAEMTNVSLCRVDINNRYEHTIHFDSLGDQFNYFQSKVHLQTNSYTQIRSEYGLQVNLPYTSLVYIDYLYFNQNGKRWFYFVNSIEYKNEGSTILHLELDVIQTYMFDWDLPPCFIERQHTESDELYEHTLDEGLECGELINRGEVHVTEMSDLCCLVFATIDPERTTKDNTYYSMRCVWDNVFSGVGIYAVHNSEFDNLGSKLEQLADWGKLDGIVSMHMYPKDLVRLAPSHSWTDSTVFKPVIASTYIEVTDVKREVYKRDYTPMNNKLYCFPYNMLCVSNNNGNMAVYRFERFNVDGDLSFRIIGGLTADSGCKIIPHAYNTVLSQYNDEAGLMLNGFPSCAWDSDTYKIWLAQNQNQHAFTIQDANIKKVSSVVTGVTGVVGGAVGGAVTGGVGGAVVGGVLGGAGGVKGYYNAHQQIKSLVAQQNDMSIMPPQAKGNLSPSLNVANGLQDFTFIYKTISDENCKIIDDYFNMYGYKINRVQRPNLHARAFYTYIKTAGCIVHGDFNNSDKLKIASIFDTGITFWRNGDGIGNYSRSNVCLN